MTFVGQRTQIVQHILKSSSILVALLCATFHIWDTSVLQVKCYDLQMVWEKSIVAYLQLIWRKL